MVTAVGFAVGAAFHERRSFTAAWRHMGPGSLLASLALGLAGTTATFLTWDQVLRGYGVDIGRRDSFRLFAVTQLGKYLPGSVWPALMQMEEGRRHGAGRRTMLGANLTAIVVGCCVGIVVACVVLPWYAPHALTRYWWLLLAVPLLLALLHPRALPVLLDVPFRLLRRPAMDQRLDPARELAAAGWSALSWLGLGSQLGVLAVSAPHHHSAASVILLSVGGMALATTGGILFLPSPAGAGVREVILVLILSTVTGAGSALALALLSRFLLIACDLALAGISVVAARMPTGPGTSQGPEPASSR